MDSSIITERIAQFQEQRRQHIENYNKFKKEFATLQNGLANFDRELQRSAEQLTSIVSSTTMCNDSYTDRSNNFLLLAS